MRPTCFIQLIRHSRVILLVLLSTASAGYAEEGQSAAEKRVDRGSLDRGLLNSIPNLQMQVRELQTALQEMRAEAAQYRAEMVQLRRELQSARTQVASHSQSDPQPPDPARQSSPERSGAKAAQRQR